MTLAAILDLVKVGLSFILGLISNGKLGKLSQVQASNQAAEDKASDPAAGNDVTDLDNLP